MNVQTATEEQVASLWVPASLPGVARRGTPVYVLDEDTPWTVLYRDGGRVFAAPCTGIGLGMMFDVSDMVVDLADETGRAHVVWAIRAILPGERHGTPAWTAHSSWQCLLNPCIKDGGFSSMTTEVQKLCADLDWSGGPYLPDGSKWSYAEALRRLAMYKLAGE